MDLWVRSISKRILLKVDNILVVETENKHCLYTLSHDEEIELGEYETKERALEVLDEIQKLLMEQNIMCFKNTGLKNHDHEWLYQAIQENKWVALSGDAKVEYVSPNTIVYEMPLE